MIFITIHDTFTNDTAFNIVETFLIIVHVFFKIQVGQTTNFTLSADKRKTIKEK